MGVVFEFAWEVRLIEAIQELIRSFPFLKQLFVLFTMLGEPAIAVAVIGFLYWCIDKKAGIRTAVCVLIAMTTNGMIKNIFRRIRPYAVNEQIECLKAPEARYDINDMSKQGFSFPSGHATVSAATQTALYLNYRNKRLLFWGSILVLAVSVSRFALGVHYPSDVLCGIILGIIPVLIVDKLMEKLDKKQLYLILFLYSGVGVFFCESNDYYSIMGLLIGFLCGDLFEGRYVRFENPQSISRMIIRTVIGALIFVGITFILKLPFKAETLEAHTLFAYLYRVFRYGLGTFVIVGLYPILFKYNLFRFKE